MTGHFTDDGAPLTVLTLLQRTVPVLRSLTRSTQQDLTALASLVRLVQDGATDAARASLVDVRAHISRRRHHLRTELEPHLEGFIDEVVALRERGTTTETRLAQALCRRLRTIVSTTDRDLTELERVLRALEGDDSAGLAVPVGAAAIYVADRQRILREQELPNVDALEREVAALGRRRAPRQPSPFFVPDRSKRTH